MTYTIGLMGGLTLTNPTNGIPYSWLVGADGKVVWQGHGTPTDKVIQEELKKVKVTDEFKAGRAAKALAAADALVAEKQLVRGLAMLEKVGRDYKGTDAAKKSEEHKTAVLKDDTLKKELAAQKELDTVVTGLEMPKEKLKKKEREALQVRLEAFAKAKAQDAPVATEMAKMFVKVMTEDWSLTAK